MSTPNPYEAPRAATTPPSFTDSYTTDLERRVAEL